MLLAELVIKMWERLPAAINVTATVIQNLSRLEAAPTEKATINKSKLLRQQYWFNPSPNKGGGDNP